MAYRKFAALLLALSFVGAAFAAPTTQPTKPYPLKTCIVSDEELGDMGEPIVTNHEGQEIKFCCGACVKKFDKDPAKYLKKLQAGTPTTKPAM